MFEVRGAIQKLRKAFTAPELTDAGSSSLARTASDSTQYRPRVTTSSETSIPEDSNLEEDEDGLLPANLNGYNLTTKNRLLNTDMCNELRLMMPTRIQLYTKWQLLYSLEQHGASLHSLYDLVKPQSKTPMRVGYVLVVKDRKGGIFGGYSNEPFHPTENRRYYGNGECFLWKMEREPEIVINKTQDESQSQYQWRLRAYPSTGLNEFYIYCTSEFLSMGAGDGHYGLWCDDRLLRGYTNSCLTYSNDTLSNEGSKFHIVGLEVWRVG